MAKRDPDVSGVSSRTPTSIKKPILIAPGKVILSVSTEKPFESSVRLNSPSFV